jgi:protein-L-isoaspartate(D-aspartate) O-methyltransferase
MVVDPGAQSPARSRRPAPGLHSVSPVAARGGPRARRSAVGQGSPAGWCAVRGGPGSRRFPGRVGVSAALGGAMSGRVMPPPSRPLKSNEDLRREREAKVGELGRRGLLRSERLRRAMLTVAREDLIPSDYRDHAYEEIPLPLPGERATSRARTAIRCSTSHSASESDTVARGWRRVGLRQGPGAGGGGSRGSGRGRRPRRRSARVRPREPGPRRLYRRGVGSWRRRTRVGRARPLDRICVTAACPDVPPPLIEQLGAHGGLIAPVEGRHAPATHAPRKDPDRRAVPDPRGRLVRLAAWTIRR